MKSTPTHEEEYTLLCSLVFFSLCFLLEFYLAFIVVRRSRLVLVALVLPIILHPATTVAATVPLFSLFPVVCQCIAALSAVRDSWFLLLTRAVWCLLCLCVCVCVCC